MSEYIDRGAAIRAIKAQYRPSNSVAQNRLLALAVHDVLVLPSADVAPVRHGRWLDIDGEVYECSACHGLRSSLKYDYCPDCGARMDGGVDE